MAKVRLLFVCVENSCRSQMAEGFARQYGGEAVDVHSAGSAPSGKVNPQAVELMRERDIDIDGQRSTGLDDLPSAGWDWVVTMGCGDACPHLAAKNHAAGWLMTRSTCRQRNLGPCGTMSSGAWRCFCASAASQSISSEPNRFSDADIPSVSVL